MQWPTRLRSLRARLAGFFAVLIVAVLLCFGATVYVAAVAIEAGEIEPQAERDRELAQVRHLLYLSLGVGVPLAVAMAALGSAWMTRRTLRALSDIVCSAGRFDATHLSQRLPVQPHDDREIHQLVGALNQMLARTDRAVSGLRRFTQDAAHELRTPLAASMNRLEIALHHPRDTSSLRGTMADVLEDLSALQRLVEALLLLARSDAGELPVQPAPTALLPLLHGVGSLYAGVAEERHLTLQIHCPETIWLHTDKMLLGRTLANLLDNACKFTPAGGSVVLAATQHEKVVTIRVRDAGPGLPPDEEGRLFERFYRAAAHRGSVPGFGLGLALVREFTQALGGHVDLKSRADGPGCEARIVLPALALGDPSLSDGQACAMADE